MVLLASLTLAGCMSDLTGTSYSAREARSTQLVRFGTIVEVQAVKIDGTEGEVGTIAGAAIGGAAGSGIGGQREGAVGAVLGALAGGVLGNMAEKKVTQKGGVELTIQLENGTYLSVVQQVDPNAHFGKGDRVKVLTQGSTSRVVQAQR
ncbi:glycine zipper 2TM domain-containing protein [Endozoicomonas sp. OPT23]|uniref:glycine zipper 2TM domain-containing protein n=1 Tax=Endozoicomonas sp. OPT23 TaxID=2072845 RepID=UPI001E31CA19|nr:glycine zipper 2TM domain-containing protein [Endozoicomonas sp. OPT23]